MKTRVVREACGCYVVEMENSIFATKEEVVKKIVTALMEHKAVIKAAKAQCKYCCKKDK